MFCFFAILSQCHDAHHPLKAIWQIPTYLGQHHMQVVIFITPSPGSFCFTDICLFICFSFLFVFFKYPKNLFFKCFKSFLFQPNDHHILILFITHYYPYHQHCHYQYHHFQYWLEILVFIIVSNYQIYSNVLSFFKSIWFKSFTKHSCISFSSVIYIMQSIYTLMPDGITFFELTKKKKKYPWDNDFFYLMRSLKIWPNFWHRLNNKQSKNFIHEITPKTSFAQFLISFVS